MNEYTAAQEKAGLLAAAEAALAWDVSKRRCSESYFNYDNDERSAIGIDDPARFRADKIITGDYPLDGG